MSIFYGSDTACVTDVPLIDVQVTDPLILIGSRVARSLQTPRGGLGFVGDDATRGYDARRLTLMRLDAATIAREQQSVQAECEKDEEVQSATVVISGPTNGVITLQVDGLTSAGPFVLTGNIQSLTAAQFFVNGTAVS